MKTSIDFCEEFDPCYEGRRFALGYTNMADVWDSCLRADWLLWILEKLEINPDEKLLRGFACWCVRNTPLGDGRMVWDLLIDKRSKDAVEVTERFVRGEATEGELEIAAREAYKVYTANLAAKDTATSAAAAAASYTARFDAIAVAYYAAYASDATLDVAGGARKTQADYLRTIIPNPFL